MFLSKTLSWRVPLQKLYSMVLTYSEVLGWNEGAELFLPHSIPYPTLYPDGNVTLLHYCRNFWLLRIQSIINIPFVNQRHIWGLLGKLRSVIETQMPTQSVGGHASQSPRCLILCQPFRDDLRQEKLTLDSINLFFTIITAIKSEGGEERDRQTDRQTLGKCTGRTIKNWH